MRNRKLVLTAAVAALLSQSVFAQSTWRVVAGTNATVVSPGLPVGARGINDVLLGDVGNEYLSLRLNSPSTAQGYWALKNGSFTRYTQIGVAGGVVGPGRSGAEAAHTFLDVLIGGSGAAGDGQRVLIGRAGDANNAAGATWGVWRWDTNTNIEIARVLTDGPLGPGLGANWVFPNSSGFASARTYNGGITIINADTTSPTSATRRALFKNVPGQGNVPCAIRNENTPGLTPGLTAGDIFTDAWSISDLSATPSARVFGRFDASSGSGIWEVCSGAPRALVATSRTGPLGPAIGIATATFSGSFTVPVPGNAGTVYYFASFRPAPSDSSRTGLFWHDGTSNRPLAMNDASNTYGPGWQSSTWNTFDTGSLVTAGGYASFLGSVRTPDNSTTSGMWRVRAGGVPELVALVGLTGAFGPEPNRTWSSFSARGITSNGDILVHARTNPGNEAALWLLKPGAPPARVFKAGDTVSVPTTTGMVQAVVNNFSIPGGAAQNAGGADSWIGTDGSVMIEASVANYGSVVLLGKPSQMVDPIYVSGFDG